MNDGCASGCGCLILIVIVYAIGSAAIEGCNKAIDGDRGVKQAEEQRKLDEERDAELARHRQAQTEELVSFAREEVPELQRLIEEMTGEIETRETLLGRLGDIFRNVGKDPNTDDDFLRWQGAIANIKKSRDHLIDQRAAVYLAFKKFELAPTSTDRDNRLKAIEVTVNETRKSFREMMKRIEDLKAR